MKKIKGTYEICEGSPRGVLKEGQYRPKLWPLTQASPFLIPLRFNATCSSSPVASNTVYQIINKNKIIN